jgi:hypothetical protein
MKSEWNEMRLNACGNHKVGIEHKKLENHVRLACQIIIVIGEEVTMMKT